MLPFLRSYHLGRVVSASGAWRRNAAVTQALLTRPQLCRLYTTAPAAAAEKDDYRRLLAGTDSVRTHDSRPFEVILPSYLAGKLPGLGISTPTPVQSSSIGTLLKGDSDVLIQAVTGARERKRANSGETGHPAAPPSGTPVVASGRTKSPRRTQARGRLSHTCCRCWRGWTT